jgi:hypothetical protein
MMRSACTGGRARRPATGFRAPPRPRDPARSPCNDPPSQPPAFRRERPAPTRDPPPSPRFIGVNVGKLCRRRSHPPRMIPSSDSVAWLWSRRVPGFRACWDTPYPDGPFPAMPAWLTGYSPQPPTWSQCPCREYSRALALALAGGSGLVGLARRPFADSGRASEAGPGQRRLTRLTRAAPVISVG